MPYTANKPVVQTAQRGLWLLGVLLCGPPLIGGVRPQIDTVVELFSSWYTGISVVAKILALFVNA